jgi:hypothetical protein
VKQRALREHAARTGLRRLVETGTYLGETVTAMRGSFDRIVSVELDPLLFAAALRRFADAEDVELVHGDSGDVMPQIVSGLDAPALFWLDAHYSGGVTARGREDTVEDGVRPHAAKEGAARGSQSSGGFERSANARMAGGVSSSFRKQGKRGPRFVSSVHYGFSRRYRATMFTDGRWASSRSSRRPPTRRCRAP